MKIVKFTYTKKDGEVTDREVLHLHNTKEYIDSIDFTKLNDDEVKEVKEIYKAYETKIEPYIKKAFRRFSKSGIRIKEENVE